MTKVKNIGLTWIVVSDLNQAKKFFTECVGLKLKESHDEYGWAELGGYEDGARLGLAQASPEAPIQAGYNAITTFTVEDIVKSSQAMAEKGVELMGNLIEVANVKLQLFCDKDGNKFQLVELVES